MEGVLGIRVKGKGGRVKGGKLKPCARYHPGCPAAKARSSSFRERQCNNINRHANGNVLQNEQNVGVQDEYCFGKFTREVYNAICLRLGQTLHIPEDSLQDLFNDMQLFPSQEEVAAMIQCARQISRRNGAHKYVTFGEFCLFVREMQDQNLRQHRKSHLQLQTKPISKCSANYEVFLGGSCNPTTWRTDTAIPELERCGISFYNPQVSMWAPELVAAEHEAKQRAAVLLYVADSQTRCTVSMIEVAYLVASGRCVVLVSHPYRPGQTIMGEQITNREYRDLIEAQTTLLALVKSRGIKVYSSLQAALQCTATIVRNSYNSGITAEEQVANKLRRLREIFDSYVNQSGEISFLDVLGAYQQLTNQSLTTQDLYQRLREGSASPPAGGISFEKFCALMAEFTTDNCTSILNGSNDVRASQPFLHQTSLNNNSNQSCLYDSPLPATCPNGSYDIYLGGSRHSAVRWREEIAIPLLQQHGLTYYNPCRGDANANGYSGGTNGSYGNSSGIVTEEEVLEWKGYADRSAVRLFVISSDRRSLTSMVLTGFYLGLNGGPSPTPNRTVLCVQNLPSEECNICDEKLTEQATKDYNRGRVYLSDYARKINVPVFDNIAEAVECAINMTSIR